MEKTKFCIRPFNSINITTNGTMQTCCDILINETEFKGKIDYNLKKDSIQDYWQSGYRKYLQEQFLEGALPNECKKCWHKESTGGKSLREFTNDQYKILGKKTPQQYLQILGKSNLAHPEDYNLDVTNLCNLKCYMCTGRSSSKLLVENNDLGIENLDQKEFDYKEERLDYLLDQITENKVNHITLQGGEPLMNPKIIRLLERLSTMETANALTVWITTNGTIYNKSIFDILSCFSKVKIIFSVDGVDSVNDYMRFPSSFDSVKSNIIAYLKLQNASFMVTNVVQNLNLLYVEQIIEFCNFYKIHCNLNMLVEPSYLHLSVLPKKTKMKALKRLDYISRQQITHVTNFDALIKNIKTSIEENVDQKLQEFKNIVFRREQYRGIKMQDYLPELAADLDITH